jgi:hypothetical protein
MIFFRKRKKEQYQIMQKCELKYISERLHTNAKGIITQFEVGEFLYRRCRPEFLSNPFKEISIVELSHNRGGLKNNPLCNPDDVLLSIRENESFETYSEEVVCTLEIKSLNPNNKYRKEYSQTKDGDEYYCVMELLHEPEPCMYPHSVFRVKINDELVTYANHKHTLGKLKTIRTSLKDELASMIITKSVNQNDTSEKLSSKP